jgi:hypothetical protein
MDASVSGLASLPNGDVLAVGGFTTADGLPANNVARWNGANWSALGAGIDGPATCVAALPNGDLVVGGWFSTVVGGTPAPYIARWNGSAWSALGGGTNRGVLCLQVLENGDLIAGGWFTQAGGQPANRVARWDGTSWSTIGNGSGGGFNNGVASLAILPNGDLAAGGYFTQANGMPIERLARFDGLDWRALGGAVEGRVNSIVVTERGDLAVGGAFVRVAGRVRAKVAQLRAGCEPRVTSTSSGCTGSGGPVLRSNLPWVGAPFVADGSLLPTPAIVALLYGLSTTSVPVVSLSPFAQPGCLVGVTPDVVLLTTSLGGTARAQWLLPDAPALIGATFHHQMLPFALDAVGNIVGVSATNQLHLSIGAFE